MKAMNFYTQNGWAGSNYDSKLSTKEIAAKVRSYAKKNFPEFKFSITSRWSMYADSIYIELKTGPCVPFVEGSRSAERGYMSTMSSVKGWENELTPKVFAALNAVSNYASSFRYNDSDGMQDYFDTNFYIHIEISIEYQVIEPKAKKSNVKVEKVEEAKEMEAVTVEGLEIVDYSEKAIAVFGDTKAIKEQLKELGGRFNPSLNYNGEKRAGWIFSKKQADKVKELIAPTELPALSAIEASKDNIIEWKEIPGCGYEGIELEYIGEGKEYGCIGRCANGTYWGAFGGVQGSTSGLTPVRKVFDNETDLLNWMRSNGFVYKKKLEEIYIPELAEEAFPLENIDLTETDNFNGVRYYDIEGAGIITSAKVRADIQPGDIFNVYTDKERKFGVTYDGVSVESSLKNDLPGIIEFNDKIESGTLSISSYYTPMDENVEFYEKKVKGKRYTVKDKPLTLGYYGILDNLDNCIIECYPTKEEAEREAETLNGFTDGNGRLKTVI
mgnify:CR=1 FL=1|jgi:hypothetical protein